MLPLDSFDVFVSSHTLEHLYAEEIEQLTEWLSRKTRYVIVSVPLLKDRGIVKGNHVLDKGSVWLKRTLKENGFSLIWDCGQWFGWFLNST
jgi:predicted SAM-dependent methyltransferase